MCIILSYDRVRPSPFVLSYGRSSYYSIVLFIVCLFVVDCCVVPCRHHHRRSVPFRFFSICSFYCHHCRHHRHHGPPSSVRVCVCFRKYPSRRVCVYLVVVFDRPRLCDKRCYPRPRPRHHDHVFYSRPVPSVPSVSCSVLQLVCVCGVVLAISRSPSSSSSVWLIVVLLFRRAVCS